MINLIINGDDLDVVDRLITKGVRACEVLFLFLSEYFKFHSAIVNNNNTSYLINFDLMIFRRIMIILLF